MADTKLFSSKMSNPLPGNARLTLKKSDGSEIGSYEPLGEDKEITLPTGGSDNVFFATYGTTTLREVQDAIAADKLVIARDLNNNQYTIAEATEVRVVFESLHRAPASASDVTYERLVLVDSPIIGGGWSSESQALAKKSDLIVHHDATLDGDGTEANPLKVVGDAKDVFYFDNGVEGEVFADALSKGKFLVYQTSVTSGSPRPTNITRNFVLVNKEQRAGDSSVSFLFACVDGETIYKVSISYDIVAETMTFGDVEDYDVSSSGGGSTTLFKTVSDMQAASLNVGDVVETAGFYSVNDGGGAKYQIQSTGTANGMDLISVAGGKIAKALLLTDCYPEQLGYKEYSSSHDLTTYVHRAIDVGIHTIKFYGKTYYQFTPMTLTSKQGIQLLGNHCFGAHGNITEIAYRPSSDNTTAITIATRGFRLENIYLGVTAAPGSSETKSANGIYCAGYDDYNKYKWAFRNLRLNSFDTCMKFNGNIKWNVTLDEIVFNFCNVGLELYESSLCIECHQIHTNSCKLGVRVSGDTYGLSFYNCNFGSIERAVEIIRVSTHIYQSVNFIGCSFEVDAVTASDLSAVFVSVDNNTYATLNFVGCNFTLTKASLTVLPDTLRCIKLGGSTRATFIQCEVLDDLSDYANLDKMFSENDLPADEYGSVSVIGSHKIVVPASYGYRYCKLNGEIRVTNKQPTTGEVLDDCNKLVPSENGTSVWCDVNSFSGTVNLPAGLSGFGKLEATLMISGSRVEQRLMASNNTIYYRRGSVSSGAVSWMGWYKVAMVAV